MKRLLIITLVLSGFLHMKAQDQMILLNYNTLAKKYEKSEADIKNPKKNVKTNTWFNRGKLMQDIFKIDLEYLMEGTGITELKLYYKEPLSVTEGEKPNTKVLNYERIKYHMEGDALSYWVRTKMVTDNPLDKAFEAYTKTLELDSKGNMGDKVKEQLVALKGQYKQQGINYYYLNDYKGAVEDFEMVLKINQLDMFAGEVDTIIIQYTGIIAREMEDYSRAATYYQKLADMNFGGPNIYLNIKNDYLALQDSASAIKVMEEAFDKYPDTLNIVANLIDLYIKTNNVDQGLSKIQQAIAANPNKGEFYYWKGRLQLNTEDEWKIDSALVTYKKAIELNESLYYVYYDIGFIYFLQGQDIFNQAGLERDAKIRQQINDIATAKYEEAIPMMEKTLELNTINPEIRKESLDVLKRIYYKLYGVEDARYLRIMDLLDNL